MGLRPLISYKGSFHVRVSLELQQPAVTKESEQLCDTLCVSRGFRHIYKGLCLNIMEQNTTYTKKYTHLPGFDHLLNRNCTCGGHPELMLDHVDDYFVRCKRCHKATWAHIHADCAVKDWNNGNTPCENVTSPEEDFFACSKEPVHYLALSKDVFFYDENLYDVCELILAIGDSLFHIRCLPSIPESDEYEFQRILSYNKDQYPFEIRSTDREALRFIRFEKDLSILRFQKGERPLLVTASDGSLMVGISHWDTEGNWLDFDNDRLLDPPIDTEKLP